MFFWLYVDKIVLRQLQLISLRRLVVLYHSSDLVKQSKEKRDKTLTSADKLSMSW